MRGKTLFAAPLCVLLLLAADQAAERAARRAGEHGFHGLAQVERAEGLRFLPALRSLLVQFWLVRIDADLRAGSLHKALRHARQVLALAPDLAPARVRLADVLAYNLPPCEADPERRLAWIAEGLDVLDDGLELDPTSALLHKERGLLIWSRGLTFPEFEQAFRETYGQTTLEAGVEALVRGAELARGEWSAVRAASIGLARRGDQRLDGARAGDAASFAAAAEDFGLAAAYLRELLAWSELAREALEVDLALAVLCQEAAALKAAEASGEKADLGGLLAAAGRARAAFSASPWAEGAARARLAEIAVLGLACAPEDAERAAELLLDCLAVVEQGIEREPEVSGLASSRAILAREAAGVLARLEAGESSGKPVEPSLLRALREAQAGR